MSDDGKRLSPTVTEANGLGVDVFATGSELLPVGSDRVT
jgi:hypothetical protein